MEKKDKDQDGYRENIKKKKADREMVERGKEEQEKKRSSLILRENPKEENTDCFRRTEL